MSSDPAVPAESKKVLNCYIVCDGDDADADTTKHK